MRIHYLMMHALSLLVLLSTTTFTSRNIKISYGIYTLSENEEGPGEDRYFADGSYFGIFDGHKGPFVSDYLAAQLLPSLEERIIDLPSAKEIRREIARAFFDIDNDMRLNKKTPPRSGAPGAVVIVNDHDIYVAHIGSTRVFVLGKNSRFWKSRNHEVRDPREMDRIRREQGLIKSSSTKEYSLIDDCSGGVCSVDKRASRSFGDFYMREDGALAKPRGLSVIPDIKKFHRKNIRAIIMVTDGIWRPYGDTDNNLASLENLFRDVIAEPISEAKKAESIVRTVRKKAIKEKCKLDDMTAIVITFK